MLRPTFYIGLLLGLLVQVFAQNDSLRTYETNWAQEAPQIDGFMDDAAWESVDWGGDFIQRQPEDGAPPSQQTAFKILYDAKFLYVGIRAYDLEPDKIVKRMSRRDGFEGDFVEINIDSYHDKRTAFSFSASVSGVKGEEYISNNGSNWDSTWDPIWYLKTSVDSLGWVAEFKVPLSQLRFADKPEHVWGIQVMRMLFRKDERSYWQPIAQDASGWVHRFGELRGIKGIKPQKQLEIQPYVLARHENFPAEEGNPYATGKAQDVQVGIDAKIGITSDITLDLTINPDFGQVEADPSTVNLGAFQLYFRERRPFFLEGNNVLRFEATNSNAGGFYNNDNLFYSRRIGSRPHYYPSDDDIAYVDRIKNTSILGAAKLTGKNKNGFSWGILESLTSKEYVEVQDTLDQHRNIAIEPMTNYVVVRAQQDINQGKALIGGMVTVTNRFLDEDQFDNLHENAYTGGIDFTQYFRDRNYYISANTFFSSVSGSEQALLQTQSSSERYFQRPNNGRHRIDSAQTQLTGNGGFVSVGKQNGNFVFQSGGTYRTAGVELNDVGFLVQSDYISHWTWMQYRILKPFGAFRWARFNLNENQNWDFDGLDLGKTISTESFAQFKNYWFMGMGTTLNFGSASNADLRGGPTIRYPGYLDAWVYISSNEQKKLVVEYSNFISHGFQGVYEGSGVDLGIRFRPSDAILLSFNPGVSLNDNRVQYVDSYEYQGPQYLLARIKQLTYSASFRANYIITPNLSIEYWGQPFISSGEYSDFKLVQNPTDSKYENRQTLLSADQLSFDQPNNLYRLDQDRDGVTDYEFEDPNFNFMQFRSNLVLRWEYIPGSTLFLVWTSNTSDVNNSRENGFTDLFADLRNVNGSNIFLLKYTYRFVL